MARILVVEDNPANLDLITYLLEAFGHTPLLARDGRAALELARREAPDLIVCDVQLPDIGGNEIARRLKSRAETRAIPLVAVTALAMVGDREQTMAAGFDGYISKPIVPETFVAQVECFLDMARPGSFAPPAAVASAAPLAARPPAPERATILVVDDSPVNRELIRSVLEPFGYRLIAADGVREAIALAHEWLPDLIVSDLHMPEQTGFDLVRAIRADPGLRQIKVVIHSATIGSERDHREALALGAQKFLTRPIEPQVLLAEIEVLLYEQRER
jgi:two-component system cell cycle response regulator